MTTDPQTTIMEKEFLKSQNLLEKIVDLLRKENLPIDDTLFALGSIYHSLLLQLKINPEQYKRMRELWEEDYKKKYSTQTHEIEV